MQQVPAGGNQTRSETPQEAFNRVIGGDSAEEITSRVIGLQNLIDNAGGRSNSEVWQQIKTIDKAFSGANNSVAFNFTVKNGADFLNVLRRNGYDVDHKYERVKKFTPEGMHQHSARFNTQTSHQPGMHITQAKGAASESFSVHWDRRSSAFRERDPSYLSLNTERLAAAWSHNKTPRSSAEIRQSLKDQGIVPSQRPN